MGQASQYPMEKAQTRMKPQTKKGGAADPWSQLSLKGSLLCGAPTPPRVLLCLA